MAMMNRIQRYILRECALGLALVTGILLIAILLIDVVEQMRSIGNDISLPLSAALRLSLMKLPMIVEQTLPFALLAACMMAFTRLNRRSELSIVRAVGLSAWRFLTPVILLATVMGVVAMMLLNPVSARLNQAYEFERARLLQTGRETAAVSDMGGLAAPGRRQQPVRDQCPPGGRCRADADRREDDRGTAVVLGKPADE